jgi:hypothetical protein
MGGRRGFCAHAVDPGLTPVTIPARLSISERTHRLNPSPDRDEEEARLGMLTEVERFRARSEEGNYETTIIIMQYMSPLGIPGLKEARTVEGYECVMLPGGRSFRVMTHPSSPRLVVRRVIE